MQNQYLLIETTEGITDDQLSAVIKSAFTDPENRGRFNMVAIKTANQFNITLKDLKK